MAAHVNGLARRKRRAFKALLKISVDGFAVPQLGSVAVTIHRVPVPTGAV
jgi:hypothetical protein